MAHDFDSATKMVYCSHKSNKENKMRFEIYCPALGETEHTDDIDRAWDICLSMHNESDSYACVRNLLGDVIGEYGDVMGAVDQGLI